MSLAFALAEISSRVWGADRGTEIPEFRQPSLGTFLLPSEEYPELHCTPFAGLGE